MLETCLGKGNGKRVTVSAAGFQRPFSDPFIHLLPSTLRYATLCYSTPLDSTLLDSTPRNRNHREVSPAKEKHPDLYSKIAAATASKQLHSASKMAPKMSLLAPLGPHLGPRANVSMPTSQNIIIYYVLRGPLSRNIIIYYTSELSMFLIFPSGLPKWLQKGVPKGVQNRPIFGAIFEVPFRTPFGPLCFPKWYQKEVPKVTLF